MKNTLNTINKKLLVDIHFSLQNELKSIEAIEKRIKDNYELFSSVVKKVVFRTDYYWSDKFDPIKAYGSCAYELTPCKISEAKKLLKKDVFLSLTVKKTYYKYIKKGGGKG